MNKTLPTRMVLHLHMDDFICQHSAWHFGAWVMNINVSSFCIELQLILGTVNRKLRGASNVAPPLQVSSHQSRVDWMNVEMIWVDKGQICMPPIQSRWQCFCQYKESFKRCVSKDSMVALSCLLFATWGWKECSKRKDRRKEGQPYMKGCGKHNKIIHHSEEDSKKDDAKKEPKKDK